MINTAENIKELVKLARYQDAYLLAKEALASHENNQAILSALYELTAKLRSECIDMAVRKADVGENYFAKERLLEQVNELTGEDMYGRFR